MRHLDFGAPPFQELLTIIFVHSLTMISHTSEYIHIRARARACVCGGVCHSVCACNIWIDEKLLSYFLFYISQGDHPCTVSDGPTKRPQYVRISRLITVTYLLFILQLWQGAKPRTSTTEFWFYTVVATWDFLWRRFQPICMVFLQSWPKATPRTLQWLFSIFGTYLEASLVAIVFSEYFPLFVFPSSIIVFQSILHVRGSSSQRTNYRSILV